MDRRIDQRPTSPAGPTNRSWVNRPLETEGTPPNTSSVKKNRFFRRDRSNTVTSNSQEVSSQSKTSSLPSFARSAPQISRIPDHQDESTPSAFRRITNKLGLGGSRSENPAITKPQTNLVKDIGAMFQRVRSDDRLEASSSEPPEPKRLSMANVPEAWTSADIASQEIPLHSEINSAIANMFTNVRINKQEADTGQRPGSPGEPSKLFRSRKLSLGGRSGSPIFSSFFSKFSSSPELTSNTEQPVEQVNRLETDNPPTDQVPITSNQNTRPRSQTLPSRRTDAPVARMSDSPKAPDLSPKRDGKDVITAEMIEKIEENTLEVGRFLYKCLGYCEEKQSLTREQLNSFYKAINVLRKTTKEQYVKLYSMHDNSEEKSNTYQDFKEISDKKLPKQLEHIKETLEKNFGSRLGQYFTDIELCIAGLKEEEHISSYHLETIHTKIQNLYKCADNTFKSLSLDNFSFDNFQTTLDTLQACKKDFKKIKQNLQWYSENYSKYQEKFPQLQAQCSKLTTNIDTFFAETGILEQEKQKSLGSELKLITDEYNQAMDHIEQCDFEEGFTKLKQCDDKLTNLDLRIREIRVQKITEPLKADQANRKKKLDQLINTQFSDSQAIDIIRAELPDDIKAQIKTQISAFLMEEKVITQQIKFENYQSVQVELGQKIINKFKSLEKTVEKGLLNVDENNERIQGRPSFNKEVNDYKKIEREIDYLRGSSEYSNDYYRIAKGGGTLPYQKPNQKPTTRSDREATAEKIVALENQLAALESGNRGRARLIDAEDTKRNYQSFYNNKTKQWINYYNSAYSQIIEALEKDILNNAQNSTTEAFENDILNNVQNSTTEGLEKDILNNAQNSAIKALRKKILEIVDGK